MSSDLALIRRLRAIVERDPRPYADPYARLLDLLDAAEAAALAGAAPAAFRAGWQGVVEELVATPEALSALFPLHVEAFPNLPDLIREVSRANPDPDLEAGLQETRRTWVAEQGSLDADDSLLTALLAELANGDFAAGGFALLARYYRFRDALYGHLVDQRWLPAQGEIFRLLALQQRTWTSGYVSGYAYQGYGRLGIDGVKPTEARLAAWGIAGLVGPGTRVLDIGSNNGFLALEIARTAGHVDAIEYNPYLVLVGQAAARALGATNVDFICGDFTDHPLPGGYDVILSLANHQTTDRNMAMPFEGYVARCWSLLRPGGHLLFESHNVFGPGEGGPGDDGDLDAKMDLAARLFEVERHTMTASFVPGGNDVDKLFVVMRRRDVPEPEAVRPFDLRDARTRYSYDAA